MNLRKYIGISLAAFALLTQTTSCLKDNPVSQSDPRAGNSNNVVEFQNSSIPVSYTSPFPQYDNGIVLTNGAGTFPINLNYTGPVDYAPQDIKITLALNQTALDSFNNVEGTSYVIPPADTYAMNMTPVIVRGTRQIAVVVTVNTAPADYDFNASYALPLTIQSASYGIISTNFGTAIYSFIGRNKYDGSYSLKKKLTGWGAYGIDDGTTYTWPNNIGVVTAGASSDGTWDGTWGAGQLAFTATGGTTAFGATTPLYTFDPATDKLVSVVNTTPDDGRGRKLAINPAVTDSRYDASTKTIYAAYMMMQNGRPTQYIYDTLVYQGVR